MVMVDLVAVVVEEDAANSKSSKIASDEAY
jgi:hypothetical protein